MSTEKSKSNESVQPRKAKEYPVTKKEFEETLKKVSRPFPKESGSSESKT